MESVVAEKNYTEGPSTLEVQVLRSLDFTVSGYWGLGFRVSLNRSGIRLGVACSTLRFVRSACTDSLEG